MSNTISITGDAVIKINGRIFSDFSVGEIAKVSFPNDSWVVKPGKNGNTIFVFKADGRVCDFVVRLMIGSGDDKFLNNIFSLAENNPSGVSLMQGEFTINNGDGNGGIQPVTYILAGGVILKRPESLENTDGSEQQSEAVWPMKFSRAPRSIG